eukprot:jgi/Chlat1/7447/Chrsp6S07458
MAAAAVLGGSQLLVTWRAGGKVHRRREGTSLRPSRPSGGRAQRCVKMSAAGPEHSSSSSSNRKGLGQKLAAAVVAPALALTLALGSPSSAALAATDTASAPTPNQQSAESSSTRMSYSRLLEYIEEGRVNKVDLYGNDRIALVELKEPEQNKVRKLAVSLPRVPGSTRELMRKIREKDVNVAAHRIEQEAGPGGFFVDLLFPGLLIGSLFLLSRRNQGGPSGPSGPGGGGPGGGGGPFNPLNIGKSKAKFQVSVDLPDVKGREAILKVHAKNKVLSRDVDLASIALRTPGFSGADLANLLNEAAILAGRRARDAISDTEVEDALDRIISGLEGTALSSGRNKTLMAYHEVGKALVASLTPGHDPVQKVSLVPRGQRQSITLYTPSEDPSLISKSQLFARIVAALGGRAAEEIVFGESETTTVAGNELRYVSQLAKQMVTVFGMSDIGPWSLQDPSSQSPDLIMRTLARNSMSEKLAEDIDDAVTNLAQDAYRRAVQLVQEYRVALDALVDALLDKETLSGPEFRRLLSKFAQIPQENRVARDELVMA